MAISNKTTIKSNFETGDVPTQSNFADLIDSSVAVTQGTGTNIYNLRAVNEGTTKVGTTARGEYSVDLQTKRSDGAYVAAGANSAIIGGENNGITSTGTGSAILGGNSNYSCSGKYSLISGRLNYNNTGDYCNISGYGNHSNGGSYCNISGPGNHSNSGKGCNISGVLNQNNSGNFCNISGQSNYSNSGYYCNISGRFNANNSGRYCNISGYVNGSNSGEYCSISGYRNQGNFGKSSIIAGENPSGTTKIEENATATASTDYINVTGHGLVTNDPIRITAAGSSGLDTAQQYYVTKIDDNNFTLKTTLTGSVVSLADSTSDVGYIAKACNYGNYCSISGYGNHSNTGDYCSISSYNNYKNSGSACSISGYGNQNNSGSHCNISGVLNQNNSGNYCNISGAFNQSNSGSYCNISGYSCSNNSGSYCNISGSYNYSNSGSYCNISGRFNYSNSGNYCSISGYRANDNALDYARVHGGYGNARIIDLVAQINSAGTGATELLLGGTGGTRIIIPNQSAWMFDIQFVAKTATGQNAVMAHRTGVIVRDDASTPHTEISASINTIGTDLEVGTTNASFGVTADTTNEALKLTVTAGAGELRAVARIQLTQVDY